MSRVQTSIGAGCIALAALLAAGASQIHGEAGYGGVSPAFLPWLVTVAFAVFGVLLIVQDLRAHRRAAATAAVTAPVSAAEPAHGPDWRAMAWVSAGLLLNAALINHLGFIVSCALLFALAARGFRLSSGQPVSAVRTGCDALIGLALSAPVYWLFTKGLGLTLPGLTSSGWI